jgi:transposase-like protein
MVAEVLPCSHCRSDDILKNGFAPRAASRNTSVTLAARQSREEPYPNGYTEERKEQTLSAYQERSSLRGLRRTLGVSPTTFTHHVHRLAQKTWLTLSRETARWWLSSLATGAGQLASVYGERFPRTTRSQPATAISGRLTKK